MGKFIKWIKFIILIVWIIIFYLGISQNYQHYDLKDWVIILAFGIIPCILLLKPKKKAKTNKELINKNNNTDKYFKLEAESRNSTISESIDLIHNSKNIETVLSRIQFLKNKKDLFDFTEIKLDYDQLQIDGITRCLEIGINGTKNPESLPKLFDKFFAIVHIYDDEYSEEVTSFVAELENSCWSKCNITKKVKPPLELNDDELKFISAFRNLVESLGISNDIQIDRKSNGDLNFTYERIQIGRVHLKRKKSIQLIRKTDEFDNVDVNWVGVNSVDAAISFLDNWIDYLNDCIGKFIGKQ